MEITERQNSEDFEAINSLLVPNMAESLPPAKQRCLRDIFHSVSDDTLEMLRNLLQFNRLGD